MFGIEVVVVLETEWGVDGNEQRDAMPGAGGGLGYAGTAPRRATSA